MANKLTLCHIRFIDKFREEHPIEYEEIRQLITAEGQVSNEVKARIVESTGKKFGTISSVSSYMRVVHRIGADVGRGTVAQLNAAAVIPPIQQQPNPIAIVPVRAESVGALEPITAPEPVRAESVGAPESVRALESAGASDPDTAPEAVEALELVGAPELVGPPELVRTLESLRALKSVRVESVQAPKQNVAVAETQLEFQGFTVRLTMSEREFFRLQIKRLTNMSRRTRVVYHQHIKSLMDENDQLLKKMQNQRNLLKEVTEALKSEREARLEDQNNFETIRVGATKLYEWHCELQQIQENMTPSAYKKFYVQKQQAMRAHKKWMKYVEEHADQFELCIDGEPISDSNAPSTSRAAEEQEAVPMEVAKPRKEKNNSSPSPSPSSSVRPKGPVTPKNHCSSIEMMTMTKSANDSTPKKTRQSSPGKNQGSSPLPSQPQPQPSSSSSSSRRPKRLVTLKNHCSSSETKSMTKSANDSTLKKTRQSSPGKNQGSSSLPSQPQPQPSSSSSSSRRPKRLVTLKNHCSSSETKSMTKSANDSTLKKTRQSSPGKNQGSSSLPSQPQPQPSPSSSSSRRPKRLVTLNNHFSSSETKSMAESGNDPKAKLSSPGMEQGSLPPQPQPPQSSSSSPSSLDRNKVTD